MRIPNTAEFLAIFVSTGQLTGFSNQPGADLGALAEPPCDRPLYTVQEGDTCNSIGERFNAPTYQIICQNDAINGKCTNLSIGQKICLGREEQDCRRTHEVKSPESAQSIANRYQIPLRVFERNNYCIDGGPLMICPPFNVESVVCVEWFPLQRPLCKKILV